MNAKYSKIIDAWIAYALSDKSYWAHGSTPQDADFNLRTRIRECSAAYNKRSVKYDRPYFE